ncbi:MAG: IS4 family transposase [Blastocatellia bacterium]|nr:IS4 family transposase [Blastocatellia bacterium]
MGILAKVSGAMQRLFGEIAQSAGQDSGVVQRQRKFSLVSLARTFVLGFLRDPKASDEKLAQMAAQCGAAVTPQAIEQRHTPALVAFLEGLFRRATKLIVGSDKSLAPILERFTNVTVLDSSTITLADEMEGQFRGCGGSYGSGASAMKLQTELDLRSGALHVEIEQGRSPDGATSRQDVRRGKGSLRIADLGYFALPVFAAMTAAGEYFLSRLQFGTKVLHEGLAVNVLAWLAKQAGPFVDVLVLVGQEQRLPCRLIAWRLPQEQANRRRQKLRQETLKKKGREPSAERLAWCDWSILVTNVPEDMLTPKEAVVLYRARWQVELLFKRWKSQGLVAELSGSTVVRQMVRVWSRLLAAVVQHWLTVGSVWGDPTKSLHKAYEAVRDYASRLAAALDSEADLERVLDDISQTLKKTCRRDKRSKAGTFELLNDVGLLDFCLT